MGRDVNIYSSRVWLNENGKASTGSVVSYHGFAKWSRGKEKEIVVFLEVSDCNTKIRLHKVLEDTPLDFVNKLRLLRKELDMFMEFLKDEYSILL